MFSNIKALLGAYATINHAVSAVFGAFRIKREVRVEVTDGVNTGSRKYFASEKYTALGEVHVDMTHALHDPRGFNTHIIDESGDVHPDLFLAKQKNAGGIPRTTLTDMSADIEAYLRPDSQLSLLVGMLSTLYVLTFKESKAKKRLEKYDDGHISAALADVIAPAPINQDWRCENLPGMFTWDQTMIESAAEADVLWVNRLTDDEVAVVCSHLGGRRRTTQLAFDLNIPKLTDQVKLSGCRMAPGGNAPNGTTARLVQSALNKYVETNRLYGTFEAALAIYHQIALTPVPDTAEGLAWLKRARFVTLPRFSAWRGTYRIILGEKPYGISSAVTTSWKWWREAGLATAVPASQYNAASLWGRYFVEAKYYHSDADITRLGSLDFAENPGAAYYAYAALVTGGEAYCAIPPGLGMTYGDWSEGDALRLSVSVTEAAASGYDLEEDDDGTWLVIKNIPPPCSLIHVLGKMPAEGIFSCLASRFEVKFDRIGDGWVFPDLKNAWGFGMATRWLGYDCEMSFEGRTKTANWASNESSIAVRPFHIDGPDRQSVKLNSVTPRGRVFDLIPGMGADLNKWTVTVSSSEMMMLTATDFAKHPTRGVFLPPNEKDVNVIIPPAEGLVYAPMTIRMTSRGQFVQAGFQIVTQTTPHHPPDTAAEALLLAGAPSQEEAMDDGQDRGLAS